MRTYFLRSSSLTSSRYIDWSLVLIVSLINVSVDVVVAQKEFHALHTFLHVYTDGLSSVGYFLFEF